MDVRKTILLRARLVLLGLFFFALLIIGKLVYIQFFQGEKWEKKAQATTIEYRSIEPIRGNIFAQNGDDLLATSLPFYKVAIDPCIASDELFFANVEALSCQLADYFKDKHATAYQSLLIEARQKNKRYLLLNNQHINHQAKNQMSRWPLLREGRYNGGGIFEKIEIRYKPFQELASRTIGFINKNQQGVGIEYSFNKELKGVSGAALYQKLTGGRWKMIKTNNKKRPIHGYDIETTIDINLQDVAHASLLRVLEKTQANYGTVIVMEVATGEIKALVNLGRTLNGTYKETYNYAFGSQGNKEPGSTFKLISMLAILEESNLSLTDSVDIESGKAKFYGLTLHDTKRGFGKITLQEAFERSSNIGIAKLADSIFKDKPQKFIDYIYQLGLQQPLGIPLAGEAKPFIKSPKNSDWTKVTIPWMSMGYELQITPLQLLTIYNAVANNGVMLKPLLVKRITYANRIIKTFRPTIIKEKICSMATLQKLQTMLIGVVENGIANKFNHGFYKIAGKSGTANKVENGKYGNTTYTSFAGYFPAEQPRYSCIVVVDNPIGIRYHFGSQVSAPVVKEIADRLSAKDLAANRKKNFATPSPLPPPIYKVANQIDWQSLSSILNGNFEIPIDQGSHWFQVIPEKQTSADSLVWQPVATFTEKQIPKVVGMPLKDALYLLENRGLIVNIEGPKHGHVRAQSLAPGSPIKRYSSITLNLRE